MPRAPFRVLQPELETEYRTFRRREEIQSLFVVGLVVGAATLAFIDSDLRLNESEAVTRALIAARLFVAGLIAVAFFAVSRGSDHRTRDLWVMMCAFGAVGLDIAAAFSRPPGFTGNVAVSPVVTLVLYVAVPGPQRPLVAAALLESIGALAATAQNEAAFAILFSLVGALFLANWVGLLAMARMNHWGREHFVALHSLTKTNRSLESTLAEVRTLREIIPVCASCKSVRDDAGFWERVEVYAARFEGGQVSHGICPTCFDNLYGSDPELSG